jgi:glycolate oxidase
VDRFSSALQSTAQPGFAFAVLAAPIFHRTVVFIVSMNTLISTLANAVPADRILTRESDRAAYEADAQTAFRCRAAAVVLPKTSAEVIAIVRWCREQGVPFVVRGSGTGLSAGATPTAKGIVIVTTHLNRILRLDPDQRIAVVQPGVVNADVTKAASAHGLFFAPDPSSQPVCSIGGNIGFNAGGAHCLKYGMTSNHVLGLKAVLASGEVVEWGGTTRDAVGPDYHGLFVGNEGLFGIVLEATLNLLPTPDGCHTVLAGFTSAEAAGDAVSAIIASGLVPVAMELMDALTIEAVRPVVPIDYPPNCNALLLIELDGPAAVVEAERPQLEALLRRSDTTGMISAQNELERANIWKVRKSSYSAFGRLAPNNFVQDSVVPRRHLGATLREVNRIADQAGLRCPNVCHAGDGNLHPNLLYDGEDPGAFQRAEEAAGAILRMCVEFGGSITGEHGVGLEKRTFLPLMYGPTELDLFRRLHQTFDPAGLANPGKMLPDANTGEPPLHPLNPSAATLALAAQIKAAEQINPVGGNSKALTGITDQTPLSLASTRGIASYEPVEFVLTAGAGTPLAEIETTLAEHGQKLPFDPPFSAKGATLGGAIASGLSGPAAFGAGRVRDAILGVTFIDGRGEIMRVGAAVVKNVAGFDLPKMFVGSHGSLGIMTEITLKVCPAAASQQTFAIDFQPPELAAKLTALAGLPTCPAAIEASLAQRKIWVSFAAPESALPALAASLAPFEPTPVEPTAAASLWAGLKQFDWVPADSTLLKIPTGLDHLDRLLAALAKLDQPAQLSLGGDVAYVGTSGQTVELVRAGLVAAGFAVQTVLGIGPRLVRPAGIAQIERDLKTCFDPAGRLPPLPGAIAAVAVG